MSKYLPQIHQKILLEEYNFIMTHQLKKLFTIQYCSDKQKLETRFLKETGFLAPQLFLTEQYWFTILLCAVLSFGIIGAKPALAITFDFNWKGDAGYTAEGSFSYDEEEGNSVITLDKLEFLKITFFDPTNKFIKSYVNVKDGKSTGVDPYLEFNFNTSTKSLVDSFDVGESNTVGENDYYLQGKVGAYFEFRNLDLNVLDSNSGAISVKKVGD